MNKTVDINDIISSECELDLSGIWVQDAFCQNSMQTAEYEFRNSVAERRYPDYLEDISKFYSVDVMDKEVKKILHILPDSAWILDVGGGWGWHWRRLSEIRPDVSIIIIDFVKKNLLHAKNILSGLVGQAVHLLHADATLLPLNDGLIDLFWSVQCHQHIPNITDSLYEAKRVLRNGGEFRTYNFNYRPIEKLIYSLSGKNYLIEEDCDNFFLRRSSDVFDETVGHIFKGEVMTEYTEIIFQPNFRIKYKPGSMLGKIDAFLSGRTYFKNVARQRTTSIIKKR